MKKKRSTMHEALVRFLRFLGVWRAKKHLKQILYLLTHGKAAVEHILFLNWKMRELESEVKMLRTSILAGRTLPSGEGGITFPADYPETLAVLLDGGVYALNAQADTNALRALAESLTLQQALYGEGNFVYTGSIPPDHLAVLRALLGGNEKIFRLADPNEESLAVEGVVTVHPVQNNWLAQIGGTRFLIVYENATPAQQSAARRVAEVASHRATICAVDGLLGSDFGLALSSQPALTPLLAKETISRGITRPLNPEHHYRPFCIAGRLFLFAQGLMQETLRQRLLGFPQYSQVSFLQETVVRRMPGKLSLSHYQP